MSYYFSLPRASCRIRVEKRRKRMGGGCSIPASIIYCIIPVQIMAHYPNYTKRLELTDRSYRAYQLSPKHNIKISDITTECHININGAQRLTQPINTKKDSLGGIFLARQSFVIVS